MEGNSLISFENLCKIFEMRIKLDKEKNVKTSKEVLDNYEKYSKKIDSIYNSEFQKELKPLISPAVTLEKEKDRLRRLIKLLEERLDRRLELEDKYYETTGKYISGLQIIVSEDELEDKRERLSVVNRYLETSEEIESVTESINKLKDLLIEEENKKEEYESKNKIMEDELYSSFMSIIKDDDYYKNLKEEDITSELDKIRSSVSETKETLDITRESVGSLLNNGLEDDYASYIEEAERSFYNYKNKEIILKIYKLVIEFEDDFKLICAKREKISELIEEKKEISESLIIDVDNELLSFEKVVLLQSNTLDNEREVLDNITNYTSRIKFKEERLEELNEVNNSVEILAILREYGLIDTYDSEDVVLEEEVLEDISLEEDATEVSKIEIPTLELEDEVPTIEEESVIEEVYDPYRIVEIIDYPITLNVGLAKLKGESVREKVNKKLNPKKEESTFEDINHSVEEVNSIPVVSEDVSPVVMEAPSFEKVIEEEKIEVVPVIEDSVKEEAPVVTPVWELPTEVVPKPVSLDKEEVSPLPVWETIEPEFEIPKPVEVTPEINNINITSKPEETGNMFWVPVSESKMDTNSFPNLNIPVNNLNKNSEFVFPTIDN